MISPLTPPPSPPSYNIIGGNNDSGNEYNLKLYHAVNGSNLKKVSSEKLDNQIQVYLSIQDPNIYLPQLSAGHLDELFRSPNLLTSQILKGCVLINIVKPIKLNHILLKLQHQTVINMTNENYKLTGSLVWDFQSSMSHPDIYYDPVLDKYHKSNSTSLLESHIPMFDPYLNKDVSCKFNSASSDNNNDFLVSPGEYLFNFIAKIPDTVPETVSTFLSRSEYSLSLKLTKPRSFPSTIFPTLMYHTERINVVRTPAAVRVYDTPESAWYTPSHVIDSGMQNWKDKLQYRIIVPRAYLTIGDRVNFTISLYPLEKIKVGAINIYWKQSVNYFKQLDYANSLHLFDTYDGDLVEKLAQTIQKFGSELPKKKVIINHKSEDYNGTDSYLPVGSAFPTVVELEADLLRKDVCENKNVYVISRTFYPSTFNPFNCLQVQNKIQFELEVSFMDEERPLGSQFRAFKLQLELPVDIFSEVCTAETIELPQYDRGFECNNFGNGGGRSDLLPIYEERPYHIPVNNDNNHDINNNGMHTPPHLNDHYHYLVPVLSHTSGTSSSSVSSVSTLSDASSSSRRESNDIAFPVATANVNNVLHHDDLNYNAADAYLQLGHRSNVKPLRMFSVDPGGAVPFDSG